MKFTFWGGFLTLFITVSAPAFPPDLSFFTLADPTAKSILHGSGWGYDVVEVKGNPSIVHRLVCHNLKPLSQTLVLTDGASRALFGIEANTNLLVRCDGPGQTIYPLGTKSVHAIALDADDQLVGIGQLNEMFRLNLAGVLTPLVAPNLIAQPNLPLRLQKVSPHRYAIVFPDEIVWADTRSARTFSAGGFPFQNGFLNPSVPWVNRIVDFIATPDKAWILDHTLQNGYRLLHLDFKAASHLSMPLTNLPQSELLDMHPLTGDLIFRAEKSIYVLSASSLALEQLKPEPLKQGGIGFFMTYWQRTHLHNGGARIISAIPRTGHDWMGKRFRPLPTAQSAAIEEEADLPYLLDIATGTCVRLVVGS